MTSHVLLYPALYLAIPCKYPADPLKIPCYTYPAPTNYTNIPCPRVSPSYTSIYPYMPKAYKAILWTLFEQVLIPLYSKLIYLYVYLYTPMGQKLPS